MKITKIIWLFEFVDKLEQKHEVQRHEVEQVIYNTEDPPQFFFVEKGDVKGEYMYTAMGCPESGRYLRVFFIYKEDQEAALIISAREMTDQEKKRYAKK